MSREKKNLDVYDHLYDKRVYLYELADRMGIAVSTLQIRLRKERPIEEKRIMFQLIDQIAAENAD